MLHCKKLYRHHTLSFYSCFLPSKASWYGFTHKGIPAYDTTFTLKLLYTNHHSTKKDFRASPRKVTRFKFKADLSYLLSLLKHEPTATSIANVSKCSYTGAVWYNPNLLPCCIYFLCAHCGVIEERIWLYYFQTLMQMLQQRKISVHRWDTVAELLGEHLLPPVLVRFVQPASSTRVSSGRLRESALSASMKGCCRLWRLGFEYIPLWSMAAPPPPAIIIFRPPTLELKINVALLTFQHTAPLKTT